MIARRGFLRCELLTFVIISTELQVLTVMLPECTESESLHQAKRAILTELIPPSVALSYKDYFYSPLDEDVTVVHDRASPLSLAKP